MIGSMAHCAPRKVLWMAGFAVSLLVLAVGVNGLTCPAKHACTCDVESGAFHIDCSNRGFRDVPDLTAFMGLPTQVLLLAKNRIRRLKGGFLDKMLFKTNRPTSTPYVELDGNPIGTISPDAFIGMQAKELGLRMSNCTLEKIPTEALAKMTNWTLLFFSHNKIRSIPKGSFHDMPLLKDIDLSGNPLKDLNAEGFAELKKSLRKIHLGKLSLESIPSDILAQFEKLEAITLNDNQIRSVDADTFKDMKTRQKLDINLKNNEIESIDEDAFEGVQFQLKSLLLDGNDDLERLEFLDEYCSRAFRARPRITVTGIECDCQVFAAIKSGIGLVGKCTSPPQYAELSLKNSFLKAASDNCTAQLPLDYATCGAHALRLLPWFLYALFTTLTFGIYLVKL